MTSGGCKVDVGGRGPCSSSSALSLGKTPDVHTRSRVLSLTGKKLAPGDVLVVGHPHPTSTLHSLDIILGTGVLRFHCYSTSMYYKYMYRKPKNKNGGGLGMRLLLTVLTRHYAPPFCRLNSATIMGGAYN